MTTATFTWPTTAELATLSTDVVSIFDRFCDLSGTAEKLEVALDEPDGMWKEALPSLEEFAALAKFVATAEIDLEEIDTWLGNLRKLRDQAAVGLEVGDAS